LIQNWVKTAQRFLECDADTDWLKFMFKNKREMGIINTIS